MTTRAVFIGAVLLAHAGSSAWQLAQAQVAAPSQPAPGPRPPGLVTFPVTINTTPPGANLYVDSKDSGIQGQTGPGQTLRMLRGTHRIILELDGFEPLETTIDLWRPMLLSFTLKPAPAMLSVRLLSANHPATGAEVYVDGKLVGSVPCTSPVPAGRHSIEIKRDGASLHLEEIEVRAGEPRQLYLSTLVGADRPAAPMPAPVPVPMKEPERAPPAAAPPPPPRLTVPVAVVPRNPRYNYHITLVPGPSCQTPCNLELEPGPAEIFVFGPGKRQFQRSIFIPPMPTQLRVQDYSLSRIVIGSISLSWGIPLLGVGGLFGTFRGTEAVSATLLLHGLAFTAIGVGLLAAIQTNHVRVTPLGPRNPLRP